mmetsp:Transcript_33863/g.106495  ORF Transcript_33863/g.106495 Transcript_33863/m.106495 type:complete len:399 (+) Transcript_33863:23-1219(+)
MSTNASRAPTGGPRDGSGRPFRGGRVPPAPHAHAVVGVEHLLQDVQHQVGWPVRRVKLLQVRVLDLHLRRQPRAARGQRHNLLRSHAARLGRKVDTLARALGHVPRRVAHERHAPDHATRPHVLRNRVRLHLHHLGVGAESVGAALADRRLVLGDGGPVDDGAGADADVVVLGEDPRVKVGRDVVADVHLGEVLIVLHLLVGDLDALLEGDGEVVLARVDCLGRARVCAVRPHDDVELGLGRRALLLAWLVLAVLDGVGPVGVLELDLLDEAGDGLRAQLHRPVAQVGVQHLAPRHADVLVLLERAADVNLAARGRDHLHLAHAPVDDLGGERELVHHAQRDRAAARLAVVHLALEQSAINVRRLGKDLCSAGARRAAADDRDAERAAEVHGDGAARA